MRQRLLREGKLGYLALLRNLRNMEQAGCDERLVKKAIADRKGAKRVNRLRLLAYDGLLAQNGVLVSDGLAARAEQRYLAAEFDAALIDQARCA